ncbi:MAG: sulfite exporter TauE/SafE family protein, partial [Desulfovibrionaceae bacterium]
MELFQILLVYSLVGSVAGVLAGLFGIGGGLVIVPMLVLAFEWQGVSPDLIMHVALATSMASIVFTSVSSARSHNKRGAVIWSVVRRIVAGILVGTFLGTFIA